MDRGKNRILVPCLDAVAPILELATALLIDVVDLNLTSIKKGGECVERLRPRQRQLEVATANDCGPRVVDEPNVLDVGGS